MEEHIEYYTDLIAHLNEQINQENIKLFDYEALLLNEQKALSEYSFFKRVFSNKNKFISNIENLVSRTIKTIENHRTKIEENKEKFVTFGTQKMIEDSEELKNIEKQIADYSVVSENINHMVELMKDSKNDTKNGINYFKSGKSQEYKTDKSRQMEKSFNFFMSALNRANDLKRYMGLDGFTNIGEMPNTFNKNTSEIINDILSCNTTFNSTIIDKMRASTKHPYLDLLENKVDMLERIDRNFDVLILSFIREFHNINQECANLADRRDEISNNYRTLFLNKIKKNSSLVIF